MSGPPPESYGNQYSAANPMAGANYNTNYGMEGEKKMPQEAPPPYVSPPPGQAGYTAYPPGQPPMMATPYGNVSQNQTVLVQPGYAIHPPPQEYVDVPETLAISIISLFFCLCFGIVSILKTQKARRLKETGQFQDAREAAVSAKNMAIVAIVVGIILCVLNITVRILM